LARGFRTPFKIELVRSALKSLGLVVSDLNLLSVACKDWAKNEQVCATACQKASVVRKSVTQNLVDKITKADAEDTSEVMEHFTRKWEVEKVERGKAEVVEKVWIKGGFNTLDETSTHLMSAISSIFTTLDVSLQHRTETPLNPKDIQNLDSNTLKWEKLQQTHVREQWYNEMLRGLPPSSPSTHADGLTADLQCRCVVALAVLENSINHLEIISQDIVKSNVY